MKINIISQYYWPEDFAAGVYVKDLAIELIKKKHEVTVLTTFPNYPKGKIWDAYKGRFFMKEENEGVKIQRSFIFPTSRELPLFLRSFTHLSFSISVFFTYLFRRKNDITYVIFPILPLAIGTLIISKFKRIPIIYGVKDISILGLINSGMIKNKLLIKLLENLELTIYSKADLIQVPSKMQYNYLIKNGINPSKIVIIPDWANSENIIPKPRINEFSEKMKLNEKFVLIYSGNLGYSSDLFPILDSAKLLESISDIHFLIIGDGPVKQKLESHKQKLNLKNVEFLDFQPMSSFADVLSTSDISIITLSKKFTQVATQGKIYNIMSAARPILAIMEKNAMSADLIKEEKFGEVIDSEDIDKIVKFILKIYKNPNLGNEMGINARYYLINNFSLPISVNHFENAFLKVYKNYKIG